MLESQKRRNSYYCVPCKLLVREALGYPTLVLVHIFSYPSEFDLSEIAAIASGDRERDCNRATRRFG